MPAGAGRPLGRSAGDRADLTTGDIPPSRDNLGRFEYKSGKTTDVNQLT
jgi:hypothetical protein